MGGWVQLGGKNEKCSEIDENWLSWSLEGVELKNKHLGGKVVKMKSPRIFAENWKKGRLDDEQLKNNRTSRIIDD